MEGKGFPTLPAAIDLYSRLIGQNWVIRPPLTAREAGKVDHRIIIIGLDPSQCTAGPGTIASPQEDEGRGHWAGPTGLPCVPTEVCTKC